MSLNTGHHEPVRSIGRTSPAASLRSSQIETHPFFLHSKDSQACLTWPPAKVAVPVIIDREALLSETPFELLDLLAAFIPLPRKHRHRYHGVFVASHSLRLTVTARAIGNIRKQQGVAIRTDYADESRACTTGCGLPERSC